LRNLFSRRLYLGEICKSIRKPFPLRPFIHILEIVDITSTCRCLAKDMLDQIVGTLRDDIFRLTNQIMQSGLQF